MNVFTFTKHALKQFENLDQKTQNRLQEKLLELKNHPNIFSVLLAVTNLEPATHRLRIGTHRLLLCHEKGSSSFLVLKIGHRRDIYD